MSDQTQTVPAGVVRFETTGKVLYKTPEHAASFGKVDYNDLPQLLSENPEYQITFDPKWANEEAPITAQDTIMDHEFTETTQLDEILEHVRFMTEASEL